MSSLALPASALAAPAETSAEADVAPENAPIDTEARAMTAYNEGKDAYDHGDYNTALQLFLEAQSLYPSPVFHYNIARCYESLENYEQANISYEAYLRSYKSAYGEEPEDQVDVENTIEKLELTIDKIKAEEEAAAAEAAKPKIIIQQVPGEDTTPPGRGLMITGGVLMGVGVALAAGGGAGFGVQASGYANQLDAVYNDGNPERVTLDQARDIDAAGRGAELGQIISLSVGGAMAVAGVALLAVGLVKKKQAASKPKLKQPEFAPTAGPTGAGLVIRGRF